MHQSFHSQSIMRTHPLCCWQSRKAYYRQKRPMSDQNLLHTGTMHRVVVTLFSHLSKSRPTLHGMQFRNENPFRHPNTSAMLPMQVENIINAEKIRCVVVWSFSAVAAIRAFQMKWPFSIGGKAQSQLSSTARLKDFVRFNFNMHLHRLRLGPTSSDDNDCV